MDAKRCRDGVYYSLKRLEGTTPYAEAGPSGASPAQTFPGARPPQMHTVLQIRYARGPAPGIFLLGRMNFYRVRTDAVGGQRCLRA